MTQTHPQTASVLFRREYQHELEDWLRTRFRSFCIACIVIVVLDVVRELLLGADLRGLLFTVPAVAISIGVISTFAISRRTEDASRDQIISIASTLIVVLGSVAILTELGRYLVLGLSPHMLYKLFLWHLLACLFLPWTSRESLRPFAPLMIAWAIGVMLLTNGQSVAGRALIIITGLFVFIPGVAICAWRLSQHSREFRARMVGKHFMTMRQEISRARSIHETMFPAAYDDGSVAVDYIFLPMREMGGDYLHLHVGPEGVVHCVVIDVTGHGLAAALTVNRLFGELERIRAERPRIEPGELLHLLNRYVHLTLARHNIFASAACLSLDPYGGVLRWASAGHPPGFVRRVSGGVEELDSTAMILGAVGDDDFIAEQSTTNCQPGDAVVVYTDGVFEARNRAGESFGLDRLRQVMRSTPAPRNWPQFITSMIEKHNGGRYDDDVLVALVRFNASRVETGPATSLPRSDVVQSEPA